MQEALFLENRPVIREDGFSAYRPPSTAPCTDTFNALEFGSQVVATCCRDSQSFPSRMITATLNRRDQIARAGGSDLTMGRRRDDFGSKGSHGKAIRDLSKSQKPQ